MIKSDKQIVVGIYAYVETISDNFGGIETHVGNLVEKLHEHGFKIILHCLSNKSSGIHVHDQTFYCSPETTVKKKDLVVFKGGNGPGIQGVYQENCQLAAEQEEQIILAFGTRDGYVFEVAREVATKNDIPLISFIFFTREESWWRSNFVSRTRSIPGIASTEELQEAQDCDNRVLKQIMDASFKVVVPTHYVRSQLITEFGIPSGVKTQVIYHGISEKLFSRPFTKWNSNGPILMASRLSVPFSCNKNFLWAIEFYKNHYNLFQGRELIICGSGNGVELMASYAKKHNISNQVKFYGSVAHDELSDLYRNTSLILIPSMMEAGSNVCVEAAVSGCLPISLDFAGLSEIMHSIGLGDYLIPPTIQDFNPSLQLVVPQEKAAKSIIMNAINNPQKVEEDLANAHKTIRKNYLISSTTSKLIFLIRECIENYE